MAFSQPSSADMVDVPFEQYDDAERRKLYPPGLTLHRVTIYISEFDGQLAKSEIAQAVLGASPLASSMGKVLPTDRGYKAANLFKERLLEHYRPAHIFPDCGPDSSTEQAFSGGTSLRTQNRCSIISATQFFSDSGFGDDWAGRLALRMPSCPKDADPHLPEIWQHLSRFEEEHLPSIQTGPQGGDDFNDSIHRGDFFSAAAVSTIRLVTFICVHLPQTKLGSGYFRTVCEIVQFVSYLKAHGVTGAYSRPLGDFLSEYAAISEIAEALYEPCWVGLHFRDPLYARQYPAALGRQTFHRWLDTIKERTLASSGSNADIENFQSEFDKVKQSNKLAQYDPKDAKAKFDLIFCHEPTLLDALASMQALDYDTKVPDSSVVCIELLSRSDFDSVHDQWFGRVMFQNVPRKLPVPNSTSCWAYLCIYTLDEIWKLMQEIISGGPAPAVESLTISAPDVPDRSI